MKPIHLAALGAALAVAAILFFALDDDGPGTAGRTRAPREAPVRRPVDFDEYVPTDPPASGTTWELMLAVALPDGAPAGGQDAFQNLTDLWFVVDHQDVELIRCGMRLYRGRHSRL